MGDQSNIEWTDATTMTDRGGRRVRYYYRKRTDRPGTGERRKQLALGLKWCRGCKSWLSKDQVTKTGMCRAHNNEADRIRYATDEAYRLGRNRHSQLKKRGVPPVPPDGKGMLLELFDGECAYCDRAATTWDHVNPVSKGGLTEPGNMLPACVSCNSSKHDLPFHIWANRAPAIKLYAIEYLANFGSVEWPANQI